MKKILLKVVIGVIAIPTVTLGALFVTRNIPVVNEKVIEPLAQVTKNLGLPVIVKPKISEETMRKCIGDLKYIYYVQRSCCEGTYPNEETDTIDEWLEKLGCLNPETQELQNIKAVNNQEGFGTKYFILLYSEKEGYNLTWREFLETDLRVTGLRIGASEEDIQKCLQLDLDEDIPMNDLSVNSNLDEFEEKNKQLEEKKQELEQQYSELIQNGGDIEKANNLLKQCYEIELEQAEVMLQKYTKEYEQAVKEGDTSNADALKGYIKMHEEMKKETEQKLMNYK